MILQLGFHFVYFNELRIRRSMVQKNGRKNLNEFVINEKLKKKN